MNGPGSAPNGGAPNGREVGSRRTGEQRLVLQVAILASFVAILDGSVVNLALPAISRELGGGLTAQQWIVDAYLLTLGALILVAGSLSDAYGRVRVMQWGLLGFAVTSMLCGLAPTDTVLAAGRALQGVAGALLVPSSLAMIMSSFSDAAQGRAIGAWTGWTTAATIASPIIGGLLVDLLSWRFVFFINIPPIIVALALTARLRHLDSSTHARIDVTGALLAVLGLGGAVFALIEQGRLGWGHPLVYLPLAAGLAALAAFLLHERRSPHPMMPLGLFTIRNFWSGNLATLSIYGALSFGFLILTLYLQQVVKLSATETGVALMPSTLLLLLFSARFGTLSGRHGPRLFMAGGPIIAGVGFLLLLRVDGEFSYWTQVLPAVLVFGLGLAITVAPLTSAILGSVPSEVAGMGSAINNAVARVAGLITVACAGLVVGSVLDLSGLHQSAVLTGILLIGGGLISALWIRNPAGQGARPQRSR